MMNRKRLLCGLGLSMLLLLGCAPKQQEQVQYIGSEQAKTLALQNANQNVEGATFRDIVIESRNGMDYYKVEFSANGSLYAYDIDALTGVVIADRSSAPQSSAVEAMASFESSVVSGATPVAEGTITEEQAKAKALSHAALSPEQVTFVRAKLDREDGRQIYEVEFYTNDGKEYDYEIDSVTSEVISYDYDAEHYTHSTGASAHAALPANGAGATGNQITAEQAKSKALAHAGFTADKVTFLKARLDRDDGRQVYDVEFYTADYKEYDYEIDASSGAVIGYDYDADDYAPPAASGSGVTADQAKQTALSQVPGATAESIVEFETDYDDGRLSYEGTIRYDGREYEFEIDGYSGAIREWDSEMLGR